MLELILAGSIVVSLIFYALTGGADFGTGVWYWLAAGPRREAQRELIAKAIAPIWEANHVWLILVITVLFTAFPKAFALIGTRLHIPLTLMLIGIVLRGSAFAFRQNDVKASRTHPFWDRIFAVSSVLTSVLLGITLGAIASGLGTHDGSFTALFIRPWLAPFPLTVGLFALAVFAFLAAVYLTLETADPDLQEDFRRRALGSAVAVWILAILVLALSQTGAPEIRAGLAHQPWGWGVLFGAAILGLGAVYFLGIRRFSWARFCAAGQVTFILMGWALAQYPYLVEPDLTIWNAAAPPLTLRLLLVALLLGALLLFPSLYYLYRVFKFGDER